MNTVLKYTILLGLCILTFSSCKRKTCPAYVTSFILDTAKVRQMFIPFEFSEEDSSYIVKKPMTINTSSKGKYGLRKEKNFLLGKYFNIQKILTKYFLILFLIFFILLETIPVLTEISTPSSPTKKY